MEHFKWPFPFADDINPRICRDRHGFFLIVITSEARDLLFDALDSTLHTASVSAKNKTMNKSIVAYTSLDEMKAAELREWQAMPPHERLRAVAELTLAAYRMKEPSHDARRIQRTLVHLQRTKS